MTTCTYSYNWKNGRKFKGDIVQISFCQPNFRSERQKKKMLLPRTVSVFVVQLVEVHPTRESLLKKLTYLLNDLLSQYDENAVKILFFKMDFLIITTILAMKIYIQTKCWAVFLMASFIFFLGLQFQFSTLAPSISKKCTSGQIIGQGPTGPTNIYIHIIIVCSYLHKMTILFTMQF